MDNDLTVLDDDGRPYGEAMSKLNERQRAFVIALVWKNMRQTDAAADAGYSPVTGNRNSLAVIGSTLARDERIAAACREELAKVRDAEASNSFHVLIRLRDDPCVDASVRRKCAIDILDRSGWGATSQHNINVVHETKPKTSEDIINEIRELGKNAGWTPKMIELSINHCYVKEDAAVIDAEYQEVEPQDEPTPEELKAATAKDRANELRRLKRRMTPDEWEAHKAQTRADKSKQFKDQYRGQQNGEAVTEITTFAATVVDENSIDDLL